jgi:hypothetical protein
MTTIVDTIVADVKAIWGDVVSVEQTVVSRVENGILTLWNVFTASMGKLTADEATLLNTLVKIAVADAAVGDIAGIETAVLNLASQAGATFIADLGSPLIQAFIALVVSGNTQKAP